MCSERAARRRALLRAVGAAVGAGTAGCLADDPEGGDGDAADGDPDDAAGGDPDDGDHDDPADDAPNDGSDDSDAESLDADPAACSPARHPLSERLTDEAGDRCHDRASPSVVVANEREESVEASLVLEGAGTHEASHALAPGERTLEPRPVELDGALSGTVTVGGEETAVEWSSPSCYRHAIAIVGDGIETGWIEPTVGPGDAQHDCYAGDDAPVRVSNEGGERTVEVEVVDLCTGERDEVVATFDRSGAETIEDVVVTGRDYDLTVRGDGVETTTHEYRADCWWPYVSVAEDGSVTVHPVPVF